MVSLCITKSTQITIELVNFLLKKQNDIICYYVEGFLGVMRVDVQKPETQLEKCPVYEVRTLVVSLNIYQTQLVCEEVAKINV